ncbi:hypothetical protein DB347_15150 [Opitutaceae bacterium EW11]|nr:hypothetical protein DB347_15150 [Opitutaceae bacterium EW11]
MKILIIEDDQAIRDVLIDLLELNGYAVLSATSGEEGVRLSSAVPDLILCDIGLPGIDGFQVISAIREQPGCREIPFLFLTARADRGDLRKAMALGADDYLTKPFTEHEVIEAIQARVARHKPLRDRIQSLISEKHTAALAEWSHELLTPLNGVLGGLELIEMSADSIDRDELKEALGLIRAGAERQRRLSRKLVTYFDTQRPRAGAPDAEIEICLAPETIAFAATSTAASEGRVADVAVHAASSKLGILASRLVIAVSELVENALRFSESGDRVTILGSLEGATYRIAVSDEGPGISADERNRVGPFVRFPRRGSERPGLGLGLATVRSIADSAGGRFALEDGPHGRGLTATLIVPARG